MAVVVKMLKMPDSGLDVKTRMWLKITIPNAFIGNDTCSCIKCGGCNDRHECVFTGNLTYFSNDAVC